MSHLNMALSIGEGTHINITISYDNEDERYDLRIPLAITVKELLVLLSQLLHKELKSTVSYRLRVVNKHLVLFDYQVLQDYPLTDGDILIIL